MSHPTHQDIAKALGIDVRSVSQLCNRGMPIATIKRARVWFEQHGFNFRNSIHAKHNVEKKSHDA